MTESPVSHHDRMLAIMKNWAVKLRNPLPFNYRQADIDDSVLFIVDCFRKHGFQIPEEVLKEEEKAFIRLNGGRAVGSN